MSVPLPIVSAGVWGQDQQFAAGSHVCRGQVQHGFHAVIVVLRAVDGMVVWGERAPPVGTPAGGSRFHHIRRRRL
jgi:hypothetical protein